jgi:hypothetical protein
VLKKINWRTSLKKLSPTPIQETEIQNLLKASLGPFLVRFQSPHLPSTRTKSPLVPICATCLAHLIRLGFVNLNVLSALT